MQTENKTVRVYNAVRSLLGRMGLDYQENFQYLAVGIDNKPYDYLFSFAILDAMGNPICFIDYCTRDILTWYHNDLLTAKYVYRDRMQSIFFQMNAKVILISEDMAIKDMLEIIKTNIGKVVKK